MSGPLEPCHSSIFHNPLTRSDISIEHCDIIYVHASDTRFRYSRNRSSNSAAVDPQAENAEGEKKGPSKSELKKMAKEAEKEKKRIEREAKEAAAKAAREAADVVCHHPSQCLASTT